MPSNFPLLSPGFIGEVYKSLLMVGGYFKVHYLFGDYFEAYF